MYMVNATKYKLSFEVIYREGWSEEEIIDEINFVLRNNSIPFENIKLEKIEEFSSNVKNDNVR